MSNSNKFKIIIFTVILLLISSVSFVYAAETVTDRAMEGLTDTAKEGYGKTIAQLGSDNIPSIIGRVVGAGLAFIGALFLVLMIYGGFIWMTARGNEQQTAKAKELIYAAVIGIIIILSAYAVTVYVSGIFGQS